MKQFLFCLFSLPLLYAAQSTPSTTPTVSIKRPEPFAPGIKLTAGGYYENKRKGFGELDLFVSLFPAEGGIVFADLRFIDFKKSAIEGNVGLGIRSIYCNKVLFGLYGFFDRKKTNLDWYFNQITVGLEVKTALWSLTGNGYFPIGTKKRSFSNLGDHIIGAMLIPSPIAGFENIEVFVDEQTTIQRSLRGFDIELGRKIFKVLELFIGMYCFGGNHVNSFCGVMTRGTLTFDINPSFDFVLEGKYSYDETRKSIAYVGGRLTYHFRQTDKKQKNRLVKRLYDRVRRDLDVVTRTATVNDTGSFLFENAAGNPALVKQASNATDFLIGLQQADIIGVIGNINLPGAQTISFGNDNVITGGNFAITNTVSLPIGQAGEITLGNNQFTLGENNTIEQMKFTNNDIMPVITANSFIGNFVIDHSEFSSQNEIIGIGIADGSTGSTVKITNSKFLTITEGLGFGVNAGNSGLNIIAFDDNEVTGNIPLSFNGNAGDVITSVSRNKITVDAANPDSGIVFTGYGKIGTVNGNIISFSGNPSTLSDGAGISFFINTPVTMTVDELVGNQITYTGTVSTNTSGIGAAALVGGGSNQIIIGQNGSFRSNNITFSNPNNFTSGIRLETLTPNSAIQVFVNSSGQSLQQANTISAGTAVSTSGDVTITP